MPKGNHSIEQTSKNLPTIDVIINFVDEYIYVKKAIKSVLKSKNISSRIILQDDSGKDNSHFFAKYLRINDIYSQSDQIGYLPALKEATKKKTSSFIAILNADDLTHENRFYNQIQHLESTDLDVSIGKLIKFKLVRWLQVPALANSASVKDFCPHLLWLGPFGADSSWVARNERIDLIFECLTEESTDWSIALEKFFQLRVALLVEAKYYYRQHQAQFTRLSSNQFEVEINKIAWQIKRTLNLDVSLSELKSLALPWKSTKHGKIESLEAASRRLIHSHKKVCKNHNSFEHQVVRRLLIQVVQLKFKQKIKYLLKYMSQQPKETLQFLTQSAFSASLRSNRKSK